MADNEPPTSVEEGTPFSLSAPFCEPSMLWKRTDGGRSSPGPVSAWRRGGRGDGVDVIGMGVPWLPWRHSVNAVPPDTLTASFRKKNEHTPYESKVGRVTRLSPQRNAGVHTSSHPTPMASSTFSKHPPASLAPLYSFFTYFFSHMQQRGSVIRACPRERRCRGKNTAV